MEHAEGLVPERRVRRWRSAAEKRRIVELTLVPGASVALVVNFGRLRSNHRGLPYGDFRTIATSRTAPA